MLQREPSVLITAAINSTNLLPCLKAAQETSVAVIDLDGNLDPTIWDAEGIKIAFRIGSDNVAAGAQAADYMAEKLGADATGPVLIIEGLSGNVTGQNRVAGFRDRLAELAPGLEVVASLPGDWDRGKAATIMNDILVRHPDLVGVFAANDGMALGAVESAFAGGVGDDVVIIGVDGNSDAVNSIKAGRLTASVAQLPYLVGAQAVENAQRVGSFSGGQQQTVAIARALTFNPKLVIMDEPTAALAVREVQSVLDLIRRLRDQGISVILISHRLNDVLSVTDRIVVLRQGRAACDLMTAQTNMTEVVGVIVGSDDMAHAAQHESVG